MLALLVAIFSSASLALALKYFRDQSGNRYGILLGNYLSCILLAFLLMPDKSVIKDCSNTALCCGAVAGIFFVAGLLTMQTSIRLNGATLTSAFAKLGLVVSLAVSIAFFGERPQALQIAGIILVFIAILILNSRDKTQRSEPGTGSVLWLLLTMLAGGGGDSMAKVFEQFGSRAEDNLYFLILFLTAGCFCAFLAFLERRRSGKKILLKEFSAGLLVGIPNYFASFLLLKALVVLPAILVYPVFSTGTILVVTLFSTLFFHEKPGRRQLIGLAVILCALVLLNLN